MNGPLMAICWAIVSASLPAMAGPPPVWPDVSSLCTLWDGDTKMVNALWIENPAKLRMGEGRDKVVLADLKGPGIITMIHFAMPETLKLNRDAVIRMWWDGEKNPSVDCPLVDFFCDPNGALERVDTALVNKRRGWNAYFPMPFAKSARIELACENPRYPATWQRNPCYSYVIYRQIKKLPKRLGYFHAQWRQETTLLGTQDYLVFEAEGRGQFVGWNVAFRALHHPKTWLPVDQNEKFFIDGEQEASIEWQGIEDSFGFSYGFPETANSFPFTGWQTYYDAGAAAYRFCLNDRISFKKSLRMTVGFGKNEHPMFSEIFSKPENPLVFSSVAYWYQTEPHRAMPPLPSSREKAPAFLSDAIPANAAEYQARGETVAINCGKRSGDIEYLKEGWDFVLRRGYLYEGWPAPVNHCWADKESLEFEITCPKGAAGTLRLFIIDGDNFDGGRKESVSVAGRVIGQYESFQQGQWLDAPVSAADTAQGGIPVIIKNLRSGSNVVVSLIRFVANNPP